MLLLGIANIVDERFRSPGPVCHHVAVVCVAEVVTSHGKDEVLPPRDRLQFYAWWKVDRFRMAKRASI